MKITEKGLQDVSLWEEKGYAVPRYDRQKVREATRKRPVWIHFGAGNLFRAFHANLAQEMLQQQAMDTGIVAAEGYDYEVIQRMNKPLDDMSILVTLKGNGHVEKTVVGSVVASHCLDREKIADFQELIRIFCQPSLQMATFTITEKGYAIRDGRGAFLPAIAEDFQRGPDQAGSYLGKVASLLYARYQKGAFPIAMVSTDNCSHNGEKLQTAMEAFAGAWTENGMAEPGFLNYVTDSSRVSFPWTMIDKITPRPDAAVMQLLKQDGVENVEPIITGKNTYIAPYVNAEETQYLVVEDCFPGGRPQLEKVGVLFTTREVVERVEKMKVCTCLNPLHTALAVFGCLLGYRSIWEEMRDADLVKLVNRIGYQEGLPVAVNPGILQPEEFLRTVLEVRLPNPFMPDTPHRIATDTSQKLSVRFGETIKAYAAKPDSDKCLANLEGIPMVLAAWLRYLCGVNDQGEAFVPSPDPLWQELKEYGEALKAVYEAAGGKATDGMTANTVTNTTANTVTNAIANTTKQTIGKIVAPLMHRTDIFGVDLFQVGLAEKVTAYLSAMLEGPGAVRRTLQSL